MILILLGLLSVLTATCTTSDYEGRQVDSLLQERYPFSNVKASPEQHRVYTYRVPAYAAREYGLPVEGGYFPPYKTLTIKADSDLESSQTESTSSNCEEAFTEAAETTTTTSKPTTTRPRRPKPPVPKPPPPPPPPLPPPPPSTNSISASPPKNGKDHQRLPPKPHTSSKRPHIHKVPPKPPSKKKKNHYFKDGNQVLSDSPMERVYIREEDIEPVNREYITEEDTPFLNDYNVEFVNQAVVVNNPESHLTAYYEYSIPVLTTSQVSRT